jgi:glycosyltransferase involved in cell wall biosynthesis
VKILILSFYFPPDLCAGSFRIGALLPALLEHSGSNTEFEVLTTMPNRYTSYAPSTFEDKYGDKVKINRISLPRHRSGIWDQAIAFGYYARAVRRITRGQNYDLVFATSSRLMTAVLGAEISRRCRARFLLDLRDIFTDTIVDVVKRPYLMRILAFGFRFLEHRTFQRASAINIVSDGFAQHVLKINPGVKITHFTNGIDAEFIDNEFKKNTSNSDRCRLVYAGNIGEGQGMQYLVPPVAASLQGSADFHIIGGGGKRDELAAVIRDTDISNVKISDPVSRDKLLQIYREADILFLCLNDRPAFLKVLPSKLFEYAATGKPILAGVGGFAAEFIEKNVPGCRVFRPGDQQDMIDKFYELRAGPRHFERQHFINQFSRDRLMSAYAQEILK